MGEGVEIDRTGKIVAVFYVVMILLDSAGDCKWERAAKRTDSVRASGRDETEVVSVLMEDSNRVRVVFVGRVRLQVAVKIAHIGSNALAVIDTGYIIVVQLINAGVCAVRQFVGQRTVIGHAIHRYNSGGIAVHLRLTAHFNECHEAVRFRKQFFSRFVGRGMGVRRGAFDALGYEDYQGDDKGSEK